MQFERIRKNHKRKIIIGGLILVCVTSAITITTTRAKYKLKQNIKLAEGNVNYKTPDLNMVAVYQGEGNSDTDYTAVETVPTSGYTLNNARSYCAVGGTKDATIGIAYSGGKVTISNLVRKGTKCYLYFDTIKDTTKPTITNVTTTVTKTEINVTVSATDNIGVTEYWYQLNSNTPVKGTGSTHKFTGLSAGTTYTVKVYVKDAAGNQSDTTTKSVQTTPEPPITIDSILAGITIKTGTPTFSNAATTDEGVYKVSDPAYGGYSYYWRGAVTNNYVKFAGKCWRIVRINGDKTMRLIYDGATCHANGTSTSDSIAVTSQVYNVSHVRSEYVGYTYTTGSQRTLSGTASNLKSQTDTWYNNNIGNNSTYASKVADGKYCNDRNIASGSTWSSQPSSQFYYAARERLRTNKTPTLSCNSGDVYTLKVGAITADEVAYAGGVSGTPNSSYYLYNDQFYWTMSPYSSAYGGGYSADVYFMSSSGYFANAGVNTTFIGLRPVINLKADTLFQVGGNGTLNNPYVAV